MTTDEPGKWRAGVRVVRGAALDQAVHDPGGTGRATAFDFAGSGGAKTWIGTVALAPGACTGAHHHGRHEVANYVVKGRSRNRWGEHLEFAAEIGPGDLAHFTPHVPHQEENLDAGEAVDFVVVRSDNERIVVRLSATPATGASRAPAHAGRAPCGRGGGAETAFT